MSAASGLPEAYYVIVDSGASKVMTNNRADAIPGTLKKLDTPVEADGIAGGLTVEYKCMVAWETLDTYGNPINLVTPALVCEDLPCRLLSPQSFLTHSSKRLEDHFRVYCNRAECIINDAPMLSIDLDKSFLPSIPMFAPGSTEKTLKALTSSGWSLPKQMM